MILGNLLIVLSGLPPPPKTLSKFDQTRHCDKGRMPQSLTINLKGSYIGLRDCEKRRSGDEVVAEHFGPPRLSDWEGQRGWGTSRLCEREGRGAFNRAYRNAQAGCDGHA